MKIGKPLKKLREQKHVSPKEMADVIDMSLSNYYKIERNDLDVSLETTQKLATYFNLSIDEFLSSDSLTVNVTNHDGGKSWAGINQTFHEQNMEEKKLFEKIISSLEKHNAELKNENEFLKNEINYLKEESKEKKSMLNLLAKYLKPTK